MTSQYIDPIHNNISLYYVAEAVEQNNHTKDNPTRLQAEPQPGWYYNDNNNTTYGPYKDSSQALSMLSTLHFSQFVNMRKAG